MRRGRAEDQQQAVALLGGQRWRVVDYPAHADVEAGLTGDGSFT